MGQPGYYHAITKAIEKELGQVYDDTVVMDIYTGYAEPGYGLLNDEQIIVSGNWNPTRWRRDDGKALAPWQNVGPRLAETLEELGAEVVWYDEWVGCSECHRAMRVQPDSYSWTMYGAFIECDYVCADCMSQDVDTYIEDYVNDPDRAVTWCESSTLRENGWVQWEPDNPQEYESGWHPGQTDDPKKILEEIKKENDELQVVFLIDSVGQFDVRFSAYTKEESMNEIITDPGKFEGERKAVKVAYEKYLEGNFEDDDGDVVTVILENGETIRWYESGSGFVYEVDWSEHV